MNQRSPQLHTLSGKTFRAPLYSDHEGRVVSCEADGVPLVTWPDGSWCHEGNRFIREAFEKARSRNGRGGSLAIFAGQISHLLRFCWRLRVHPLRLSDNEFFQFIQEITDEESLVYLGEPARNSNTVIDIGRRCISFLDCVGRHYGEDDFVSATGRIRASKRVALVPSRGKGKAPRRVVYWHHPALPQADPKSTRAPVAKECIDKLRSAAITVAHESSLKVGPKPSPRYVTLHRRDRRLTSILLLECTGARRGEIVLIQVKAVLDADRMEHPMLKVPTLKKRKRRAPYRYIPISKADVRLLLDYIEYSRNPLLRKLGVPDHGVLLVGSRDGQPLQANSITNDLRLLAVKAGLTQKASPHMFRHRFITKLFVRLIQEHESQNKDAFRRMLLSTESLKRRISEWTGHRSLAALDGYIDLAFDEISGAGRTFDLVSGSLVIESAIAALESRLLLTDLERLAPADNARWLRGFLSAIAIDLKASIREREAA
jgi:integrase